MTASRILGSTQSDTTSPFRGAVSHALSRPFLVPALGLAFLVVIFISVLALRHPSIAPSHLQTVGQSAATEQQVETEANLAEPILGAENDGADTSNQTGITSTTTVENGQAKTQVTVNGQEIPVDENAPTHQTLNVGNTQVNIDSTTSGSQSTTTTTINGFNSSSSSVNSFSQSFLSTN